MTSSSSPATMDSNGFSQIGRYGTISLMKRQNSNAAVTAFGIDTEQLTFGRDPACGVRLYYPDVGLVHCKIVFEEHKAFLVVLGANGLFVDGCKVYPNGSPSSSSSPAMIPLTNNSEFEIHGKLFRFTYPPKELRAALYASPARPANRALRLSMIQSTHVFSPRPSPDPRENLRILKSPLKNTFKSPYKSGLSTPLRTNLFANSKYAYNSPVKPEPHAQPITETHEEEEEDNIILVEGNHPRVVEDEKDLIILEDIEVPPPSSGPNLEFYHSPQAYAAPPPPQTPARKRSLSRNTLHRAVLIRSAQRAVMKAERDEREREQEEEEEMEVLDAVASVNGDESDEEVPADEESVPKDEEDASAGSDEEDVSEEELVEDEEEVEDEEGMDGGDTEKKQTQKLTWRKSLERLWPFRSTSPEPRNEEYEDGDDAEEDVHAESDNDEQDEFEDTPAPLPPSQTPARRPLGSFMTPQVYPRSKVTASTSNTMFSSQSHTAEEAVGVGRYSLGGGEARRVVRTEQVWKVRDIIVPEAPVASSDSHGSSAFAGASGLRSGASGMPSPIRPSARETVDEEERKAIQERRRSALREAGTFFPGGVPGMGSPTKPVGWSPAKASSTSSSTTASSSSGMSPFKPSSLMKSSTRIKTEDDEDEDEEAIDTRGLLERMKETVEGMKRRRSVAPPATPVRANGPATPAQSERRNLGLGPRSMSPSKAASVTMMNVAEEEEGECEEKENVQLSDAEGETEGMPEQPVFSLLRPGVLDEVRAREENVKGNQAVPASETLNVPTDPAASQAADVLVEPDEESPEEDEVEVDDAPLEKGEHAKPQNAASPPEDSSVGETVSRTKAKSTLKVPARRARTKSAEVDTAPADNIDAPPVPKSTARRGRKAAKEVEDSNDEPLAPTPTPAPAPVPAKRGRKAATAEPEEAPAAGPPPRRGCKPTAEPEEEPSTEEKAAPVKKGRKPAAIPAPAANEAEDAPDVAAPTKRSGRKAAATPAALVAEDSAEPAPRRGRTPKTAANGIPARKTAGRGKNDDESSGAGSGSGGTRRGTKAKPIDVENEDDPLDSIVPDDVVTVKPKGRKKAVKEEPVEEDLETVAAPTKSRAKPATLKTPAVKARVTTKTPATAPPAVQEDVNKENTPSTEGSVFADVEEPAKVRVSRTTRKAASGTAPKRSAKAKREDSDDEVVAEPEAPRGRVMRTTRARTRT